MRKCVGYRKRRILIKNIHVWSAQQNKIFNKESIKNASIYNKFKT